MEIVVENMFFRYMSGMEEALESMCKVTCGIL
jgi:hypothetical protein